MNLACVAAAQNATNDANATAYTYSHDVAPIVLERCVGCHRAGASAPFSLTSYDDVRKRARQIAEVVQRRYMPPWMPDSDCAEFADARRLSDAEIAVIVHWVKQGAAEGNAADAPPTPPSTEEWQLGQPDLVLTMPQPYTLPADGRDVFRNFVLPVDVAGLRYVRAVEFRLGNPRVVHHANLKIDLRQVARKLEQRDPEPGFDGMETLEVDFPDGHILGWAPGRAPSPGIQGLAWRLPKGADLVLMLHLLPSGKPETIQASVGLYFTDQPPARMPYSLRLGSQTIDIPPGESAYVIDDEYRLPVDVEVIGIYPHAHYLGHEMQATATLPNGAIQKLLCIRQWDFNWQDEYRYAKPVPLPRGTKISVRMTYDNSAANAMNPNRPPRRVVYGPNSSDEMGDMWIQVLPRVPQEMPALVSDFRRKELAAEIAGYEHTLKRDPSDFATREILARRYISANRIDDAVTQLREAVRLNPTFTNALCSLGVVLQMRNNPAEATACFRKALSADPNCVQAHLNLGLTLQSQGKAAEAMESFQRAAALQPDNGPVHVAMGTALLRQGSTKPAVEHFRQALESNPDDATTRHNLAAALLTLNELGGAIEEFRRALALNPGLFESHVGLARALRAAKQHDEALAHFNEALKIHPDHPSSLAGAAWILATHPDPARRNPAQAVKLAERAAQLTRLGDPGALDALGAAYAAAGAYSQAIQAEQAAIELARKAGAAAVVNEYSQRLQTYQQNRPFIELADAQR